MFFFSIEDLKNFLCVFIDILTVESFYVEGTSSMVSSSESLFFFLPEFFLGTSILILTLHCVLISSSHKLDHPILTTSGSNLAIIILIICMFLVVISALKVYKVPYHKINLDLSLLKLKLSELDPSLNPACKEFGPTFKKAFFSETLFSSGSVCKDFIETFRYIDDHRFNVHFTPDPTFKSVLDESYECKDDLLCQYIQSNFAHELKKCEGLHIEGIKACKTFVNSMINDLPSLQGVYCEELRISDTESDLEKLKKFLKEGELTMRVQHCDIQACHYFIERMKDVLPSVTSIDCTELKENTNYNNSSEAIKTAIELAPQFAICDIKDSSLEESMLKCFKKLFLDSTSPEGKVFLESVYNYHNQTSLAFNSGNVLPSTILDPLPYSKKIKELFIPYIQSIWVEDICVVKYKTPNVLIYNGLFKLDSFSLFLRISILFFGIIHFLIIKDTLSKNKINNFEYILLTLSSIFGLFLLITANDFLVLYLTIELQSLCLYVLAASRKSSTFSVEAGLKYFILGALSSALLLFGISTIYLTLGTTNFTQINSLLSMGIEDKDLFIATFIGALFVLVSLLFKVGAVPFHIWSPDVYEGSPTPSTLFFVIIPKFVIFGFILRIYFSVFSIFQDMLCLPLAIVAICSVGLGSYLMLTQKKLKRLFTYSSIAHVGYLILSLAGGTALGGEALFFYLVSYLITNIGIWSLLLAMDSNSFHNRTVLDLSLITKNNKYYLFVYYGLLFSLAGIPPLVGFYSKYFVFTTTVEAGLIIPSGIVLVISAISTFYYIRLLKNIYFEKYINNNKSFTIKNMMHAKAIVFSTLLVIYLFF